MNSAASNASAGRNRFPPLPIKLTNALASGENRAESTERSLVSTCLNPERTGAKALYTSIPPLLGTGVLGTVTKDAVSMAFLDIGNGMAGWLISTEPILSKKELERKRSGYLCDFHRLSVE